MELKDYVDLAQLIVFVVLVALPLIAMRRAGQAVTPNDIAKAIEAARPVMQRVRTVAEGVVLATEQIKREGRLSQDEAFTKAFAEIRKEIPAGEGVTDADIIREINRAVLIASTMTAQIDAAKSAPVVGIEASSVQVVATEPSKPSAPIGGQELG